MSAKIGNPTLLRKFRVLLVDDHAIVREGFAALINSQSDLEVCGQVGHVQEAVLAVRELKPDVVVVDLSLPESSGLELIKKLKVQEPLLRVLVLSMHEEGLYADRALRAGALGYVMKREDSRTFLQALHSVLQGRVFLSAALHERMLRRAVGGTMPYNHTGMAHLSDRELEVFRLIGMGRTTQQIADELSISVSTVETHRAHIKEKLDLTNGNELMRCAVEWVNSH